MFLIASIIKYRNFILLGFSAIFIGGLYLYAYDKGHKSCARDVAEKTVSANLKTHKQASEVLKNERNMSDDAIGGKLCDLGVVWDTNGCE